jgi:acetate---CoA ligase (ADP-forming)
VTSQSTAFKALFDPRSVAVVGASDDPVKWGNWVAARALRGRHRREVWLVNRRAATVLGEPAYNTISALPGDTELFVLAVPAATLKSSVEEAIAKGAKAIVAITGAEADGMAGGAADAELAALVQASGVRLLGPNCLGVFDAGAELMLISNDLPTGSVGFISQSGNLALEIGSLLEQVGLGFSRFASIGNQADIVIADLIHELADHEQTKLIAVYAEDFRDGRATAQAAQYARSKGKSVVMLAIEASEAASRAVASHTGALASSGATIDSACRAAGISRVRSPQELVDVAFALLGQAPPRGRRVAVLADGGGHGSIATGLALACGLDVPAFSDALRDRLRRQLPPAAAAANPIDLAGGGEQDVTSFARVSEVLLGSDEVDALLISGYFGGYALYSDAMGEREREVAASLAACAQAHHKPVYVHSMHAHGPALAELRAGGVPVYRQVERPLRTLAILAGGAEPSDPVRTLPAAAAPVSDYGYLAVRELLADAGIRFATVREVVTADAAARAAAELGYPVVVKALGLLHKSDAGGVVVGIEDEKRLREVVADLQARLAPASLSVEQMAKLDAGVELLVGVSRDPRFGPVALVGLGGIFAEALRDTATAIAPVSPAQAKRMLLSLRGAALLHGVRGRPALDIEAAAAAVAALSEVAASHPEIAELEINPLLVTPEGATGLDARAVSAG